MLWEALSESEIGEPILECNHRAPTFAGSSFRVLEASHTRLNQLDTPSVPSEM